MGTLTESMLHDWISQGRRIAGKSDGEGLTFTLSVTGTAAWTLRYRIEGRRKELTLGRYPDISLIEARRLAEVERSRILIGRDVAAEKQEHRGLLRSGRRIEAMRRAVALARSDLQRIRDAARVARLRLNAAMAALKAEEDNGKAD